MALTDTNVLEELVNALVKQEEKLSPRAFATLLLAKARMGLDVTNYRIYIYDFETDLNNAFTVSDYGQRFERVLNKQCSSFEVINVVEDVPTPQYTCSTKG